MPHDPEIYNPLSFKIIGCCLTVHRRLGPGLLESVYEDSVAMEMAIQGLEFQRQVSVPVEYSGKIVGDPLRLDFLIGDLVVLEIKSVDKFHPVHTAQVLTYLKLTKRPLALLVNFNTAYLRDGIKRFLMTPPHLTL